MTETERERESWKEKAKGKTNEMGKKRIKDEKKERSRGVPLYVYPFVLSLLQASYLEIAATTPKDNPLT